MIRKALDETTALLDGTGVDPAGLDAYTSVIGTTVTVTFASRADIETVAAADRAKVEHRDLMRPLGHREYSALYDRPGRRMLLLHRCFPHCPDFQRGDVVTELLARAAFALIVRVLCREDVD